MQLEAMHDNNRFAQAHTEMKIKLPKKYEYF